MILCLFGTNPYEFSRLAIAIDRVSLNFSDDFFVQSGSTAYEFRNCHSTPFLSHDTIINKIQESRLVICQGGYGSIVEALENNKLIISIPRRPELNESADKQCETVKYFHDENLIETCSDGLEDLEEKIIALLNGSQKLTQYSEYLSNKGGVKVKDIITDFLLTFDY